MGRRVGQFPVNSERTRGRKGVLNQTLTARKYTELRREDRPSFSAKPFWSQTACRLFAHSREIRNHVLMPQFYILGMYLTYINLIARLRLHITLLRAVPISAVASPVRLYR
jgi:hypothetical protein